MKVLGRLLSKYIKAKKVVIFFLAIISIIGFLLTAIDIWLQWGLGLYNTIIAQFLLGLALYYEAGGMKLFRPRTNISMIPKMVTFSVAVLVMATAIVRFPQLGLMDFTVVKEIATMTNLLGAFVVFYEVFILK